LRAALAIVIGLLCASGAQAQAAEPKVGEVLPIQPPKQPPITEQDYRTVPPPPGAPNVLIVLLDQVGYADPSTFGGQIRTPTLDRLAKDGLTDTNVHVNSLCSPSRISPLTGRNSHQAGISAVVDGAMSYPGDNGTRPPSVATIGEINGTFMEWSPLNGVPEDIPYLLSRLGEYGGPKSYPNYSVGWAVAGSTPTTWCIFMSHAGGNMAGAVVHWPQGIKAKGEKCRQYTHRIDIAPTILEAAGISKPKVVNGVEQIPMAGTSMLYSFNDGGAKERHTTQDNEVVSNRSIYHNGWLAAVVHVEPWYQEPRVKDFAQDKWELYNMNDDFGLATDLAAKYPEKVESMKALWLAEAKKNNVLPLDDRKFERMSGWTSSPR
jgi:arylsulfatase A-like enzyme